MNLVSSSLHLHENARILTHEFEPQTDNKLGSVVKSAAVEPIKVTKFSQVMQVTQAPLTARHLSAMRVSMGDFLKYLFLLIMVALTGGKGA